MRCASKEYAFIPHSRVTSDSVGTLIPFPIFLQCFASFPSIPRIHVNGIVLTQSLFIQAIQSTFQIMRICYYCNTDIVLCFYIHQYLCCLYQQCDLAVSDPNIRQALPVSHTRWSVWFYLDTGDAMQWYRASNDAIQNHWSRYHCILSSCVFNGLVISLPNIAHPNFCFGSQDHRSAFRLPIPHPVLNEIRFASFFFPRSTIPSPADRNTKANK